MVVVTKGFGRGEVSKQLWFASSPPIRAPETTLLQNEKMEPGWLVWVTNNLFRLVPRAALVLFAFSLIGTAGRRIFALMGSKCPACGKRYRDGYGCPACKVEGGALSRPRRLGEILVASGIIDANTLESALAAGRATHKRLGEILLKGAGANVPTIRAGIRIQAMNSIMALRTATLIRERTPQPLTGPVLVLYMVAIALGVILAGLSLAASW